MRAGASFRFDRGVLTIALIQQTCPNIHSWRQERMMTFPATPVQIAAFTA
jgi:hypothetical protein